MRSPLSCDWRSVVALLCCYGCTKLDSPNDTFGRRSTVSTSSSGGTTAGGSRPPGDGGDRATDANPAIGCMIITGNEKAFAAGADITEMADKTYKDRKSVV